LKFDLLSLRLFVIVVEEGTISAAAAREHIAVAAVSKRISELEALFEAKLLNRTNKGVSATPAGMSLLYMARGMLNDASNMVAQMKVFSSGQQGIVHVLVNISAITQFLPALIKSFMDLHPLVEVVLEERRSLDIAENIADIGVYTRLPHSSNIEVYPFRTDELVLVVPDTHPLRDRETINFAETLDYEYVLLRSGTHLNFQMLKAASDAGKSLRSKMEVSNYDAMWMMVQAGIGIAILPRGSAENYRSAHTHTLTLTEPWAHRELSICVRSVPALSPAARLFFDYLRSH